MKCKFFTALLKIGVLGVWLFALLSTESFQSSPGSIGYLSREITAVLNDSETQLIVFLFLGLYFTAFVVLRFKAKTACCTGSCGRPGDYSQCGDPTFWITIMLLIGAVVYTSNFSPSTPALILLAGAVISQAVVFWAGFNSKSFPHLTLLVPHLLVALLFVASVWNIAGDHSYEYHTQARWSGPWENPNIFGLLMGTGTVLAASSVVLCIRYQVLGGARAESWKLEAGKYVIVVLYLLALVLMGRGFLHSYSRGAWIATLCGIAYSVVKVEGSKRETASWSKNAKCRKEEMEISPGSLISWFQTNWLPASVVLLSVIVLAFWQFRHSKEDVIASRILSVANMNDFSCRNRIDAWKGALQIIAEHPWLGAGWNQPGPLYQHYFLPSNLDDSAAIQLNDYLMLGSMLGLPALICFGMYIWLSLTSEVRYQNLEVTNQGVETKIAKPEIQIPKSKIGEAYDLGPALGFGLWTLESLQMTCRAGAIVLAIGFWFDGGLFKLATASTFWILLELGRQDLPLTA